MIKRIRWILDKISNRITRGTFLYDFYFLPTIKFEHRYKYCMRLEFCWCVWYFGLFIG